MTKHNKPEGKKSVISVLCAAALLSGVPVAVFSWTDCGGGPPTPTPTPAACPFRTAACVQEVLALTQVQTGPSVVFNANGGLDVYARDVNAFLEHRSQSGGVWAPNWTFPNNGDSASPGGMPPGGLMNSDPVAFARGSITVTNADGTKSVLPGGRVEVMYVGNDMAVWDIRQDANGKWGTAHRLDGKPGNSYVPVPAGGQVTALYSPASDMAQVFYKGSKGQIMTFVQDAYDGAWSSNAIQVEPAGTAASNIGAIDSLNGVRYLFFKGGAAGDLEYITLRPGFAKARIAPASINNTPRSVSSNPVPIIDPNGGITVIYRGSDSKTIWQVPPKVCGTPWCGEFDHPTALGSTDTSDFALEHLPAAGGKPGKVRVSYRSFDQGIFYVQQHDVTGATGNYTMWDKHRHQLGISADHPDSSAATLLSQQLFSNIGAITRADGRQDLFFVGNFGDIRHIWELAPPTVQNPYPQWSAQESLGGSFQECAGAMLSASGQNGIVAPCCDPVTAIPTPTPGSR